MGLQSHPRAETCASAASLSWRPSRTLVGDLADQTALSRAGLDVAEFSSLIRLIYQGALEPLPWSGALSLLRDQLQASWVTLILRPASLNQPGLIINASSDGCSVAEGKWSSYSAFSLDPFVGLPPECVVTVDEMLGEGVWFASDFYKQFVEPYDIRYMLGADIRTEDGIDCRFRVCRPDVSGPFTEADKTLCQMLLPHLKLAIQLHSRLDVIESERKLLASAVDRLLVATVILDESGAILKTNHVADEILEENDGLRLARGGLEARYGEENRELQRLIKQALTGIANTAQAVGQAMAITRPSGRVKLGVAIRPIPLSEWSEGARRPAVTVFIRDPDRKAQGSRETLHKIFDLTLAEGGLALLLAEGLTLEEAAEELGVRKNTARAHLRSIFSKTGVTRQTALVRLLLASVAPCE